MAYIEKECQNDCDNCHCCHPNDDTNTDNNKNSDREYNNKRWAKVIGDWDNMTFDQKAALFTPFVKWYNSRLLGTVALNLAISKDSADMCRAVKEIVPIIDYDGDPSYSVVFKPIDPFCIPDTIIRDKAKQFAKDYGFIY